MFQIKLLILLLTSSFLYVNCSSQKLTNNYTYKVNYISGGVDGLNLSNILINNLKVSGLYDDRSEWIIDANIGHSTDLFITNTNNTSDRERVNSSMEIIISKSNDLDCQVYRKSFLVNQFYIMTENKFYISNISALNEIKYQNTEILVQYLLEHLKYAVYGNCLKNE